MEGLKLWELLWPGTVGPVAFIGGGGKTTALARLGREAGTTGADLLLTVTTRWGDPPSVPGAAFRRADDRARPGSLAEGPGTIILSGPWLPDIGKHDGLTPEAVDVLTSLRPERALAVEADGSAGRPFKVPGPHEPVVPTCCLTVVCVSGADALGARADRETVHRLDRFTALLDTGPGTVITPRICGRLMSHPEGSFRGVPPTARRIWLVNGADTPERRLSVRAFLEETLEAGAPVDEVAAASLGSDDPVHFVLKGPRP